MKKLINQIKKKIDCREFWKLALAFSLKFPDAKEKKNGLLFI